MTKMMFHYRWAFDADVDKARRILPLWADVTAEEEPYARMSELFAKRQIGRLAVVGSNETTAPVIEESYRRRAGARGWNLRHDAAQKIFAKRKEATEKECIPCGFASAGSSRRSAGGR
ncbi:MAG: hypothetical protein ACREQ9_02340 [Candidatus Binatia bacterium]